VSAQVCSCGTFAIGLCQDCGDPVCGDCSLMVGGQRLCHPCVKARQTRQADKERADDRSAVDAVIDAIKGKPDPVERLVRIAWFLDKYECREDTWTAACPEYPRGRRDSAAVGRWFAAKADTLGVKPTAALQTYAARPAGRLTLMLGMPGYDRGPDIPCWSFREGSTDTQTFRPESRMNDSSSEPYTVTEWAHVLCDGRVVTYHGPPLKPRTGRPDPRRDVAGTETLRPSGLNEHALVLMAALLGLTDERPGLKVRHEPQTYGGIRGMQRNLGQLYVDDYGRPRT
jgi:hypothetical protein